MSQAPFWPVATDALIADTMHLSTEEFGAYIRLMIAQWRSNGNPLPADEKRLARMVGLSYRSWGRIRPVLVEFFQVSDAGWSQKRVAKDFAAIAEKIEKNRQNGSHGGHAKSLKNKKQVLANATISPRYSLEQTASETPTNQNQNHNQEEEISLCSISTAEPQAAHAQEKSKQPEFSIVQSPVFITLPTNRFDTIGEGVPITESKVADYEKTYPAVDVCQQLRQMRQWLIDKPKHRKTANGMLSFVNSWLARSQNAGGNRKQDNGNVRNGRYERESLLQSMADDWAREGLTPGNSSASDVTPSLLSLPPVDSGREGGH